VYQRIYGYARRSNRSLDESFKTIYGKPASELSAAAAEAWRLPSLFIDAFQYLDAPWDSEDEYTSLCCLKYADHLAKEFGLAIVEWPIQGSIQVEVEDEVGIPEEERAALEASIHRLVQSYRASLAGSGGARRAA